MPSPRRLLSAVAIVALALAWLLPATALAADSIDVAGTVTRDGAPVGGVTVVVEVAGSDMVVPATTAADGTWTASVTAAIGDTLTVRAAAPTESGSPDARGCVLGTTATGRTTVTIETLPVPAIDVVLDTIVSSTTCSATPTPTVAATVAATLPATDTPAGTAAPGSGIGTILACLGLLTAAAGVAAGGRRRASRRR
jgi:hypothetical protein